MKRIFTAFVAILASPAVLLAQPVTPTPVRSKLIEEPAPASAPAVAPASQSVSTGAVTRSLGGDSKLLTEIVKEEESAISEQLDNLMTDFRLSALDTVASGKMAASAKPRYSNEVINLRLRTIPTVIPMDFNPIVQRYIEMYTMERRSHVSRMMGLSEVYFPLFEENLDRLGMPMELKYLSIVESALNPHARSRVGATGLWQFMLGTAKMYHLEVNTFFDERKDPQKATAAAMKYLKNSHEEFGDWLLAIASYNCGPGNVRKAILRSGGKTNFWEIRPYLPAETRGYVPAFIAAVYTFHYAAEHNITATPAGFSLQQDTLHIQGMDISLDEIAAMTGASADLLKTLNPELKLGRIPYSLKPYVLRVPYEVSYHFASHMPEIVAQYGKPRDQYIPQVDFTQENLTAARVASPTATATATSQAAAPVGKTLIYHTVKSGEVVGAIAGKYGVTAQQIASWNNLYKYRIKTGQRLKIYTTKKASTTPAPAPEAKPAAGKPLQLEIASSGPAQYHRVRTGDTIWGIASLYEGVDVQTIINLNSGLDPKNLKVGQTIRIR